MLNVHTVNNMPEQTLPVIKNCLTCGHNNKDRCMVSGYGTMNTRQNIREACDINFSRWEPKSVVENKKHIRWGDKVKEWITLWK